MTAYLRTLFWTGIVLLFLPHLGIPNAVKVILAIAIGCMLIFLSFAIGKEHKITRLKLRRLEQPSPEQTTINTDEQS
jgi:hypothetical protein